MHVLDAYCAHMGADLGAGGEGRRRLDPSARSTPGATAAPASASPSRTRRRSRAKARQRAWTVREVNGVVLVHHDARRRAARLRDPGHPRARLRRRGSRGTRSTTAIKTHPREIVENLADRAHFPRVHQTDIDEFEFDVAGHTATQRVKGRALLPGGGVDHFASSTTYHGPGYLADAHERRHAELHGRRAHAGGPRAASSCAWA